MSRPSDRAGVRKGGADNQTNPQGEGGAVCVYRHTWCVNMSYTAVSYDISLYLYVYIYIYNNSQ